MDSDVNLKTIYQEMSADHRNGIDESMECGNQDDIIRVVREEHHIVKVQFQREILDIGGEIVRIKKVIYNVIKGNCLQVFVDKQKNAISLCVENEDEMKRFCTLNLQEYGIEATSKMITGNPDLDSRKIKLSRPATGKINTLELRESVQRFGEIEEFYESSNRNSRKRTFIVAFCNIEVKREVLKHETLFLGKNLLKITDYAKVELKINGPYVPPPSIRISNFANSVNEYVVRTLMRNMEASFWHMPVAKNGYKMNCIIATFNSNDQLEKILCQKWYFDGKLLVLSNILEQVCLCCGSKDHLIAKCPSKPRTNVKTQAKTILLKTEELSWKEIGPKIIDRYSNKEIHNEKLELTIEKFESKSIRQEMLMNEILKEQDEMKQKILNLTDDNSRIKASIDSTKNEVSTLARVMNEAMDDKLKRQGDQILSLKNQIATVTDGIQMLLERTSDLNESETNAEVKKELSNIRRIAEIASNGYEDNNLNLASNGYENNNLSLASNGYENNNLNLASNGYENNNLSLASNGYENNNLSLASNGYENNNLNLASNGYENNNLNLASNGYENNNLNLASNGYENNNLSLASNGYENLCNGKEKIITFNSSLYMMIAENIMIKLNNQTLTFKEKLKLIEEQLREIRISVKKAKNNLKIVMKNHEVFEYNLKLLIVNIRHLNQNLFAIGNIEFQLNDILKIVMNNVEQFNNNETVLNFRKLSNDNEVISDTSKITESVRNMEYRIKVLTEIIKNENECLSIVLNLINNKKDEVAMINTAVENISKKEKRFRKKLNKKNNLEKVKNIKILTHNIRGLTSESKQEEIYNDIKCNDHDAIGFTEISLDRKQEKYFIAKFETLGKVITSIRENYFRGNGIGVVIKYPLANHISMIRKTQGRILNIVFKLRRHRELSLYIVSAPTAPYGDGEKETELIVEELLKLIYSDIRTGREIILGGDINSYPESTKDYLGNTQGQQPSILINSLQECNLVDIMRIKCEESFYTFKQGNMEARLDQFWVTPEMVAKTVGTFTYPIDTSISDHAAIELAIMWPYKSVSRINNKSLIKWDNKNEQAINLWRSRWNAEMDKINLNDNYSHKNFYREYLLIAKKMKSIAKKIFKGPTRHSKARKQPPIWYKIMRGMKKSVLKKEDINISTRNLLIKYFPEINLKETIQEIIINLRTVIKKIIQQKKKKLIEARLENRFMNFDENISFHLDNILDRKQKIDTSFIVDNNNYITDENIVKRYFFNYYQKLFDSTNNTQRYESEGIQENNSDFIITQEIGEEEYYYSLNALSKNKAGGISGIKAEMLQQSTGIFHEWILAAFNNWLKLGELPQYILRSQIWLIPKGIYDGNPNTTRPINLLDITRKLFSSILVKRLTETIEKNNILQGINFGFRKELGTFDGIKSLQLILENSRIRKKNICLVLLDIKKAYDSLEQDKIVIALKQCSIDANYRKIISNIMECRRSRVLTTIGPTKFFHPKRGVEQGDPVSPWLWNIYYETLLRKLNEIPGYRFEGKNISYLAYADDIILISESEMQMENLLSIVNQHLLNDNMELQPQKSIQVSNFECKTFSIKNRDNTQSDIKVLKKHEEFKYLGAYFRIDSDSVNMKDIFKDVLKCIDKMKFKKISIRNAIYIINNIILPKFLYCGSGIVISEGNLEYFDKVIRNYIKKLLRLPCSFPSKYLYAKEYFVGIKAAEDLYNEQEIGNLFILLNKNSFVGSLFRLYQTSLTKCHSIFFSSIYETKSNYINKLWSMIYKKQIAFLNTSNLREIENNSITCSYIQCENHNDIANYIKKKKLEKISSIYRHHRGTVRLKNWENFATKKELTEGDEPPKFWSLIQCNKISIIEKISASQKTKKIKDIQDFEKDVWMEFVEKCSNVKIKRTVWIDGSFDPKSNSGGAALIIETAQGTNISISRKLHFITNSTEAEMYALWIALIIVKQGNYVNSIQTDSSAVISIANSSSLEGAAELKQGNWTLKRKIQTLRRETNCNLNWVKAHVGIVQNEAADLSAKQAAQEKSEYDPYIDKAKVQCMCLVNGVILESFPRTIAKRINTEFRNAELQFNSRSFNAMISQSTMEQNRIWKKVIQTMTKNMNISFQDERLITFVMKMHAGRLPTNLRQYIWGKAREAECSLCRETDDNYHFFNCKEMRTYVQNGIYEAVEGCAEIRNMKNGMIMSLIKQSVMANISDNLCNGFIPIETILLWKKLSLSTDSLVVLGKNMLKAMFKIWKIRCQKNLVRCQNTKQSLYYGPENRFIEKEYSEIVSEITTKLTFENVSDLFLMTN